MDQFKYIANQHSLFSWLFLSNDKSSREGGFPKMPRNVNMLSILTLYGLFSEWITPKCSISLGFLCQYLIQHLWNTYSQMTVELDGQFFPKSMKSLGKQDTISVRTLQSICLFCNLKIMLYFYWAWEENNDFQHSQRLLCLELFEIIRAWQMILQSYYYQHQPSSGKSVHLWCTRLMILTQCHFSTIPLVDDDHVTGTAKNCRYKQA